MVHGKCSGSPQRDAPVATNSCGTFIVFMYFWIAALLAVPSGAKIREHLVALNQLARLLHGFGGL